MRVALVSPVNLLGNSATHVMRMAEELALIGHDAVVLVPEDHGRMSAIRPLSIPAILYSQALTENLPFRTGRTVEIIHAWTPREIVRKMTIALAGKYNCPYCVHMEDNEEHLTQMALKGIPLRELRKYSCRYTDEIINSYRSHPIRYRDFLAGAVGYTCLIDRLLEFKPAHVPGEVFWPGYGREFDEPAKDVREVRRSYGISDEEAIVVYTGNVHSANAQDVRTMYFAIEFLRAQGIEIRLLRTGVDHVPLDISSKLEGRVINCGLVDYKILPHIIRAADILVQPGRNGPFDDYRFPSKLPEYLISGRPVVLPDANVGKALIDGVHAIKTRAGTVEELAEAIGTLSRTPELAAHLGENGRRFAQERLQWSNAASIVDNLYEKVARKVGKGLSTGARREARPGRKPHPVQLICFYTSPLSTSSASRSSSVDWAMVEGNRRIFHAQRQVRRPADLGRYSISAQLLTDQARIARKYGLSGFCFSWRVHRNVDEFGGPLDLWLARGPRFPFCICLDCSSIGERDSLSESGTDLQLQKTMLQALCDPRYIRLAGMPIMAVANVELLSDPCAFAFRLRKIAREIGVNALHLAMLESKKNKDPRLHGFDAAIELPILDDGISRLRASNLARLRSPWIGAVKDYVYLAAQSINAASPSYIRYRSCFPAWDDTPRHGMAGQILINDSPKAFAYWLRYLVHEALIRRDQVDPLIFISAWSAWEEGVFLEPDAEYRRTSLEIVSSSLRAGFADFVIGFDAERERTFVRDVSKVGSEK